MASSFSAMSDSYFACSLATSSLNKVSAASIFFLELRYFIGEAAFSQRRVVVNS